MCNVFSLNTFQVVISIQQDYSVFSICLKFKYYMFSLIKSVIDVKIIIPDGVP